MPSGCRLLRDSAARATYPADLAPYELPAPVEYSYPLDRDTLATARRTRERLERQGAKLNHIAERIFMEVPPVHRGTRAAIRKDVSVDSVPSEGLEQRVSWGG